MRAIFKALLWAAAVGIGAFGFAEANSSEMWSRIGELIENLDEVKAV